MSNRQLEALTWVLIYSGLFILCIGLFVRRGGDDGMLGWSLVAAGLADSVLGAMLLWWRSRRPD
jgi:hypothetical protein